MSKSPFFLPGDLTCFGDYPYYYSLARRLWGEEQAVQLGWTCSLLFVSL